MILAGGLGNQLFQISALLSTNDRYQQYWLSGISTPRTNSNGIPEALSLLNITAKITTPFFNRILQKVADLNLRLSVPDIEAKDIGYPERFVKFSSALLFSILLMERIKIVTKVEEISNSQRHKCSILLIGYFQTHLYADKLKEVLFDHKNEIDILNPTLQELRYESSISPILVVHIRRSDYKDDPNFGLLSGNYYQNAIAQLDQIIGHPIPIWIFSDDVALAKKIIKNIDSRLIRWISDVEQSTSLTLIAMSYGSYFAIANSTFSWWGAYLSTNQIKVLYPDSWLKNIPHRLDLFPPNWTALEAAYE